MIKQLSNWHGRVNINGVEYQSISDVPVGIELTSSTVITLLPLKARETQSVQKRDDGIFVNSC